MQIRSSSKAAFLLLLSALLTFGPDVRAQITTAKRPIVIVENAHHVASYSVDADLVVFTLEAVDDLTDELKGNFPDADFMGIDVDLNQNGKIDKNIDLGFATRSKGLGLCSVFLVDPQSSYPCGSFASEGYVEVSFRKTGNGSKPHPVYKYSIPRRELANAKDAIGIVICFHSAGIGYTYYPSRNDQSGDRSFSNTIQVKL